MAKNINIGKESYLFAKNKLSSIGSPQTKHYLCKLFGSLILRYSGFHHKGGGVLELNKTRYAIIKDMESYSKKTINETRIYRQLAELQKYNLLSTDANGFVSLFVSDGILPNPQSYTKTATASLESVPKIVANESFISLPSKPASETPSIQSKKSSDKNIKVACLITSLRNDLREALKASPGIDNSKKADILTSYNSNALKLCDTLFLSYGNSLDSKKPEIISKIVQGTLPELNLLLQGGSL